MAEPEIELGRRAGAMERADLDPEMSPARSAPHLGDTALRTHQVHRLGACLAASPNDAFAPIPDVRVKAIGRPKRMI